MRAHTPISPPSAAEQPAASPDTPVSNVVALRLPGRSDLGRMQPENEAELPSIQTPPEAGDVTGDRAIDQAIVERVQRGDKRAFELLVAKYQRKVHRLLSRLVRDAAEVEDITQEAFIKAYRALPQFRGESAFYTWLYRIAINTAKNHLVSQGRRAPTTTDNNAEEAETFDDAEQLRDIGTPESLLMTK